jgi:hypothetical protein
MPMARVSLHDVTEVEWRQIYSNAEQMSVVCVSGCADDFDERALSDTDYLAIIIHQQQLLNLVSGQVRT